MKGKNLEAIIVEDVAADSKSTNEVVDRIEKENLDLQYLIDASTGDTQGSKPKNVLEEGPLKIANTQLLVLQCSVEEKKDCNQ